MPLLLWLMVYKFGEDDLHRPPVVTRVTIDKHMQDHRSTVFLGQETTTDPWTRNDIFELGVVRNADIFSYDNPYPNPLTAPPPLIT